MILNAFKRLENDSFGKGLNEDLVVRMGLRHQIYPILYQMYMAWLTRRSISVEDWNSFASRRRWVEDDAATNCTTTVSSMRVTTSIVSHGAEHIPALAKSKLSDNRATMDHDNPKIAAWLNTGKENCKVDPGQVARKTFPAHCRTSKHATENTHSPNCTYLSSMIPVRHLAR